MHQTIKILSWNVAGLKDKTTDPDFCSLLNEYDIISLIETFVEAKDLETFQRAALFKDFITWWSPAQRFNRAGRASGGKVLGVKAKTLKVVKYKKVDDLDCLEVNTSPKCIVIPIYLSCRDWLVDYNRLCNAVENIKGQEIVLIGDFNCRIGEGNKIPSIFLQNIIKNKDRKSADKVVNSQGTKFLEFLSEFNVIVLNGRAGGDSEGSLTFIGGNGESVIDYCCITPTLIPCLQDFRVLDQISSDHMPLLVSFFLSSSQENTSTVALQTKFQWKSKETKKYQDYLNEIIKHTTYEGADTFEQAENIISLIQAATKHINGFLSPNVKGCMHREPWFNKECLQLRKKCFALLNKFRRSKLHEDKKTFLELNRQYKKKCQVTKDNYFKLKCRELASVKDTKEFWGFVNKFKKGGSRSSLQIAAEIMLDYFRNLYNPPITSGRIQSCEPNIENEILDSPFTVSELKLVLHAARNNKAPGMDRIPYEFYKNSPIVFLDTLLELYNSIFDRGNAPPAFKEAIIFPLYKKGPTNDASSYRGISLLNAMGKLYSGLILNRLTKWAESGVLNEFQAGFRKSYSTIDNIFTLFNIVKTRLSIKRQKTYAFFIDFSSAFDSVDRYSLWVKLYSMGLSSKMIGAMRDLLTDTNGRILIRDGLTEAFKIDMGVQQGSLLSPLLFSLYINDIEEAISGGGIKVGGSKVKLLAYADDLVMLAPDPLSMQLMINDISKYVEMWNLKINLTKSKIMIFSNGGRRSSLEKWLLNGSRIEIVNSYKYLGLTLTPQLNLSSFFKGKVDGAKYGLNSVWGSLIHNSKIDYESKLRVFQACIRSLVCYGAQVWGGNVQEELERVQRYFLRRLFRLPSFTPRCFIAKELGIKSVFLYTLKLHHDYLIRVFELGDNRLSKISAQEIVKRKLFWYKDLVESAVELGLNPERLENILNWHELFAEIREGVERKMQEELEKEIDNSRYSILRCLSFGQTYFKDNEMTLDEVSIVMRSRSNVFNYKLSPLNDNSVCRMCTSPIESYWFHFLAECPPLNDVRYEYFEEVELRPQRAVEFLNGKDWDRLTKYVKKAFTFWKQV